MIGQFSRFSTPIRSSSVGVSDNCDLSIILLPARRNSNIQQKSAPDFKTRDGPAFNTKSTPHKLISGAKEKLIMITRRIIEINSNPLQDFLFMRQTILLLSLLNKCRLHGCSL